MALVSLNRALNLDCTYSFKISWNLDNHYTCTDRAVFVGDSRNVTQVSTKHLPGFTNSDVQFLQIRDQSLRLPPRDFYLFFPNLVALDLDRDELEEISNDVPKGMPKLKEFQVHYNSRLQVLENDLFKHNPKLTYISVDRNQIRHVGHNIFDHLYKLVYIWSTVNTCNS